MPNSYEDKFSKLRLIKDAVARHVWRDFITQDDNPRIIIDAGSSATAVAAVIAAEAPGAKSVAPTVFTHNLGAWQVLASKDKIDVYLIGGRYNPHLNALIEPSVYRDQLNRWSTSIAVIAVSGVDKEGLYCSNIQDERPVKEALASKKVELRLVVCDHSKIGKTDVSRFISLKELRANCGDVCLLTDQYDWKEVRPKHRGDEYRATLEACEKNNVRVIHVPVSSPPAAGEPSGDTTAASHTGNGRPRKSGESTTRLLRK